MYYRVDVYDDEGGFHSYPRETLERAEACAKLRSGCDPSTAYCEVVRVCETGAQDLISRVAEGRVQRVR